VFDVTQEADGGFTAECLTENIFTQGDSWDELRANVKDAVAAFYFDRPGEEVLNSLRSGFGWGYGHYLIFIAAAAVGTGIEVNVDAVIGEATISDRAAAWTLAIPVALYVVCVWVLHRAPGDHRGLSLAIPPAAALMLVTPLLPVPLVWTALLAVACVVLSACNPSATAPDRYTVVNSTKMYACSNATPI